MDVQGCCFKLAHNTTEISKHIVASLALQIAQSILCAEDDVCKQVGIGMPHGGLHWAKGGPDYTPTSRESFATKRGSSFAESLVHGLRPWLHSFAAARLTWTRQVCERRETGRKLGMKEPYKERSSEPLWPRVLRCASRGAGRSVDSGTSRLG